MPEIVYETVLDNATALPAGGRVQSNVVDVNGARRQRHVRPPGYRSQRAMGVCTSARRRITPSPRPTPGRSTSTTLWPCPCPSSGLGSFSSSRTAASRTRLSTARFTSSAICPSHRGTAAGHLRRQTTNATPHPAPPRGVQNYARTAFDLTPTRAFRSAPSRSQPRLRCFCHAFPRRVGSIA
jgi:hypothetical protein